MTVSLNHTDVAIVGAGPVGLTAALVLGDAGVSVQVFEAAPAIADDLRASTFHPPTLDMLAPLGITARLMAQGLVCPHWQVRLHPSGERALFDMAVLQGDTAFPFRLQCEQHKLSAALLVALGRHPQAQVHLGRAVRQVQQDADGVSLDVEGGSAVRARFLIGADGARSIVRRAIGASFDGQTYPETTILATTDFAFEQALEGLSNVSYCWREGAGNFSLLKVPGRWRVSLYPPEGLSDEQAQSEEQIEAAMQAIVPRPVRYTVTEKRAYRVHQRLASHYGQGRIWLAGDAAHLNSPAGGMGMNGGVHDAFCLAQTLIRILRRQTGRFTDAEWLAAYERQRRPVAQQQIIQQAATNRARMLERDPQRRRDALAALQATASDPVRRRAHLLRSSMIEGVQQAARAALNTTDSARSAGNANRPAG